MFDYIEWKKVKMKWQNIEPHKNKNDIGNIEVALSCTSQAFDYILVITVFKDIIHIYSLQSSAMLHIVYLVRTVKM